MKNGRLFGFLFMFLGMALTLLLMTMMNDAPGVFRILYAGPLLVGGGLGMMIMPGYQPTDEEWSDKTQRMPLIWNAIRISKMSCVN